MVNSNNKIQFSTTARKRGGSLETTIPPELIKKLNIEPGDQLNWEFDHSEEIEKERETGAHADLWNETVQSGEKEIEKGNGGDDK
jgi:antitoxin component of MazEF toxin-antitoxin module